MKQIIYFVVICISITNCRQKDAIVPDGVSTFVSSVDFKNKLGPDFVPRNLAFDNDGNLFVSSSYQIVKINPSGQISVFAGGDPGYENGIGPVAKFNGIQGLVFDNEGNLYVGEQQNNCIRKVNTDGYVSLFSGRPNWIYSQGVDGPVDGPDSIAHFISPTALAVDSGNNIIETESGFINKFSANVVRKISPKGFVQTIAGKFGSYNFGIFNDQPNYFQYPSGVALGLQDTIFVSDGDNALLRTVLPNGNVLSLAGNGQRISLDGSGKQASFKSPTALIYHKEIGLLIADDTKLRLLSSNGYVSTLTGSGESAYQDGGLKEAKFGQIADMALDSKKILYIIDGGYRCIRRIKLPI